MAEIVTAKEVVGECNNMGIGIGMMMGAGGAVCIMVECDKGKRTRIV